MPSFIATVLYKDEAYYTHSYAQAYDESIKGNGKKATNVTKNDTDIPRELLGPKYRAGEQASEAAKLKSLQTREQVPPDHSLSGIAVLHRRPASPPCNAVQHRHPASPSCIATGLYKDGTAHRCSIGAPPICGHFSDTTDDPCFAISYCTRGKGPGKGGGDQSTGDQLIAM